jgi:2-C-methyl-D-erythritol 4-phosphate cytidylyltransferase / 2-C-methyl-D-erythritol 2,4-cyclodiphosphate synthase
MICLIIGQDIGGLRRHGKALWVMTMKTVALIVAAGRGERAGGDIPKQYAMLGGVSVIGDMPVFVVIGAGQEAMASLALGQRSVAIVTGGDERQDSVRLGLEAIGTADRVLIHDAARCLLSQSVIDRLLAALETHDGAVPVLAIADSVARVGDVLGDAVDRAGLVRVQTPQAFRFDAIMTSHQKWAGPPATDDAQMARAAGFTVATIEGDAMLEKITRPEDFEAVAKRLLVSRSASGFDVHRLEAGEQLWLGGVKIPHDKGLSGHSDADVALHAITDAVLGCLGAGDIGSHFPPSDAQWRGASSDRFLDHARGLVAARGGIVDFVDLTMICEAPKIGPYRDAMRARIAAILQVPIARISIKATTTERLGFTGRGEGIAAQAIATVRVPEAL